MSNEKQAKEQGYLAHRRESWGRHNVYLHAFKGLVCEIEILLWLQDRKLEPVKWKLQGNTVQLSLTNSLTELFTEGMGYLIR